MLRTLLRYLLVAEIERGPFLGEAGRKRRQLLFWLENGKDTNVVSMCTLLAACGRCGGKVNIDAVLSAAELR